MRQLHLRHNVTLKADRVALLEAATVSALYPFRLRDARPDRPGEPVYAASIEEAVSRAEAAYGYGGFAEACDDLDVLFGLDEEELRRQVGYIWPVTLIRSRAPAIWDRERWNRLTASMSRVTRSEAVYAIRLAMELPWFGAPAGQTTHRDNPGSWKTADRHRAEKIHGQNIPKGLIHDMLARFGRRLVPFSATDTQLLERFVRAYGYEAEGMRWSEIAALWEAGVEGMKRAGLEAGLGLTDRFRHGALYRS